MQGHKEVQAIQCPQVAWISAQKKGLELGFAQYFEALDKEN